VPEEQLLSSFQRLTAETILEPEEELTRIVEQESQPPAVVDATQRAFHAEPGSTRSSLVHALSRAANDPELTLSARVGLQVLAGRMLA